MLVAGAGINPQDLTCTAILYWHQHLDNLYATRMIRLNGIHYKRIAMGCRRSLFTSGHRCARYIQNSSRNNFFLRSRHKHAFISWRLFLTRQTEISIHLKASLCHFQSCWHMINKICSIRADCFIDAVACMAWYIGWKVKGRLLGLVTRSMPISKPVFQAFLIHSKTRGFERLWPVFLL